MEPLFVYLVPETDWHVIVTDDAGHFYFNSTTKVSKWQLADIEADVANKINYDEVLVLFAKARGLDVGRARLERKQRKEVGRDIESKDKVEVEEESEEVEEQIEDQEEMPEMDVTAEEQTMDLLREVMAEHNVEIDSELDKTEEVNHQGLSLGYSSSDLDSEDEDARGKEDGDESEKDEEIRSGNEEDIERGSGEEKPIHNESHNEDDLDHDVSEDNDMSAELDLSLESHEDPAATQAFENLLNSHKSSISIYDPWFLVEEELLPKIATDPAFYAVAETNRESIFNRWVSQLSTTKAGVYPTGELLFFHMLQDHKNDVRSMYFSEYLTAHSAVAKFLANHPNVNGEVLYRQLRVTLNDFAKFERATKKQNKNATNDTKANATNGNLKVAHLNQFLKAHHSDLAQCVFETPGNSLETTGSAFAQWNQLLNNGVPTSIAHDPANFIVGDEKRLHCYRDALSGLTE